MIANEEGAATELLNGAAVSPKWIRSFSVEGLFGAHTFPDIRLFDEAREYPSLTFLYGENGVGKSTILRILFALFAGYRGGHKSYLAKIPFRKIEVSFVDGQTVRVTRPKDTEVGDLLIDIEGPRLNHRIHFKANSELTVIAPEHADFDLDLTRLASIAPLIVYVNDHRTIYSTNEAWDTRLQIRTHHQPRFSYIAPEFQSAEMTTDESVLGLQILLQQIQHSFVNSAVAASEAASVDMDNLYLAIAETMAGASPPQKLSKASQYNALLERIRKINDYLDQFGSFSLVRVKNLDRITDLLRKQKAAPRDQLIQVIEPYISAVERRIEATRALTERIYKFQNNVNKFLHNKHLTARVTDQIQIESPSGQLLPAVLSSGERHLLYLFASSTLSHDEPTLIMVDEPELSLNQTWQKKVVASLLDVAGAQAQFLMATHSFELISRYKGSAARLKYAE